ncbi:MAG TPA: ABC transporter permease subunit [Eubacteriaceae bacterium]|nr:ABC transporter permease subunit [Eubacteriaceae bacterium]
MKNKVYLQGYKLKAIWVILALIIWESIARFSSVTSLAFPSLTLIGKALIESIISGEIINQMAFSLGLIILGLIISILLALIMSSLSIINPIVENLVDTCISIFHPLPGIALLPLIILWIGTGYKAVVFIIIHSVLWPMILNMVAGFKAIPQVYKKIGRNYEFSTGKIISKIYIPASLPYIIAGLKIGWARAWRAAISAEMIFGATGGKGGIGWYIFNKRVFMDTPGLFAGLIVIIIIGILVEDLAFGKLEETTIKKWGIS